MRTVQMTLDERLIEAVDRAVDKLGTTRSAFAREALQEALRKLAERGREQRQIAGYRRKPVKRGEFAKWEKEQIWPES